MLMDRAHSDNQYVNRICAGRRARVLPALLLLLCFFIISSVSGPDVYASSRKKKQDPEALSKDGFAVLEIDLDGYPEDDIHRSEWKHITYTLRWDGKILTDESAQIKGRGNYTWWQPKRPYAIKCDSKTDWFGLGASRDWVLLANITDQTLMRNMIALTLAGQFNFAFTPECRPAHVFIDGRYNGVYLITEKVEIGKERLNIDRLNGDMILELDNNYGGGEPDNFRSELGNTFVPKDPTKEDLRNEPDKKVSFNRALANAKEKIDKFESSISSYSGFADFSQYMDMDSLVEWYIFNEIMKNDDTLFNSSIYLYNDYDGKLHMGPVWDYDLAMGGIDRNDGKNVDPTGFMFLEDYWGRPNWMVYVLKSTTFNNMVRARWKELYYSGTFEYIIAFLETQREYMRSAYDLNESVWENSGVFVPSDSYDESVDLLKNFIVKRVEWLNSQWNDSEVTAEPVVITAAPTATPPRTKPPVTSQTAAPDPAATPGGNIDDRGNKANNDGGGALDSWLGYLLLFVGLTAGLITVSLSVYLVILSVQQKRSKTEK
ncbi:MAG: CotH kinase family protein [Clostridia bacterium]|nr:CotH kinase family protein [Clostridia bacterium]